MDFSDRVVVVTGGGSGIGRAVALAFAQQGAQVIVLGRDESKLRQTAEAWAGDPAIIWYTCDVSDRQRVNDCFSQIHERFGRVDILVNNAGINVANRSMAETDPEDWDRILAVNATGAFNCMYAVLPGMRARGEGLIVNISSIAGKRAMRIAGVAYCASKFAMAALGTAVGLEEKDHGIRVTNIYPGEVNTPILDRRPVPVPPERRREMLQPEDIAHMVLAIAQLPPTAVVRELVITPRYQDFA